MNTLNLEILDILCNDATKTSNFSIIEMILKQDGNNQVNEREIWNSIHYLLYEKKIRPINSNATPFNNYTIFQFNDDNFVKNQKIASR